MKNIIIRIMYSELTWNREKYDVGIKYKDSDDDLNYYDYLKFTENWAKKVFEIEYFRLYIAKNIVVYLCDCSSLKNIVVYPCGGS